MAYITACPAVIDPKIAAIDPPQLRQPVPEHRDQALGFQIFLGEIHEHADAPYVGRLLRTRGEWPERRRAADNSDEFRPFHAF